MLRILPFNREKVKRIMIHWSGPRRLMMSINYRMLYQIDNRGLKGWTIICLLVFLHVVIIPFIRLFHKERSLISNKLFYL